MDSHENLKKELLQIANVVEKFPDDIKKQVFSLLVNSYLGNGTAKLNTTSIDEKVEIEVLSGADELPFTDSPKKSNVGTKQKSILVRKKAAKESFKIDRHLDLTGSADSPSFKEFYAEKNPTSTAEFNALAIYYLIKLKGFSNATFDQVYTCYAEVKKKPAEHFKQSFRDAQSKLGYIELNDDGSYVIPHRGVVFIEHDLPKVEKTKK
ncbi:MAG: hypothetical protein Q7U33_10235 [Methylotenera sp.]|uniref:hypothetical protein n=1 Tax=Methylotenera sp. TaxID=2051956 RepID=UPI00271866B7|nr:hypothetical protein [Methylotenera sp.]MDO9151744.1 hypothetical protein [Methylotenera sp.]